MEDSMLDQSRDLSDNGGGSKSKSKTLVQQD